MASALVSAMRQAEIVYRIVNVLERWSVELRMCLNDGNE
jgi:hypothetical protein